ncbi:helix-turn-helix transcriptional regulator [Actinoallomurus vinaceus]|uniref:Helix-turn-helix transcriptional regulator n=1 Tax=Actinoallomurus vinaceus TaxID=1080074 RepID=A0ABP8UN19_9ACTN
MSSPFVRRRRLAAELRALREARSLTADQLACLIHQSRMKISKLENAHIRPDLADVMKILDVLGVTGEKWHEIVRIARDAAERGWWDSYGDAMGDRQRLYADIESGAKTIREYQPGTMPGILQTPDYTWALIEHAKAEGPITYIPERLVEARLQRQRTVLRSGGPRYEVILDEVGLRRFSVPPDVMHDQLHHVIKIVETQPHVTVRVFPLVTGMATSLMPRSQLILFTFPDACDPPMAIAETVSTDIFHTEPSEVSRHLGRYEYVRGTALSEVTSLTFLSELADQILTR